MDRIQVHLRDYLQTVFCHLVLFPHLPCLCYLLFAFLSLLSTLISLLCSLYSLLVSFISLLSSLFPMLLTDSLLQPPVTSNYMVRPGQPPSYVEVISELGIFGYVIG